MIRPNLPDKMIKKAVVSCDVSNEILHNLQKLEIEPVILTGKLNCDDAVKNHPDLYISHIDRELILFAENNCSIAGELNNYKVCNFENREKYNYPFDAMMNCVALGNRLIGNISILHREIVDYAEKRGYELINVNQGYTKCNICVVNENSIITEDTGIYNALIKFGMNVLLLEKNFVQIKKYKYGFIGGASGKISSDKLAFAGNIKLHPEYDKIFRFLYNNEVEAISLGEAPLFDYGSILPIE